MIATHDPSGELLEKDTDCVTADGSRFVPALRALGVVKRYRRQVACDGVHLLVRPGEIFGLLGPNGAGKSTFVKLALGLARPTAGSLFVFGRSVSDVRGRQRIGYLPELFRYQPWLTAIEVVNLHTQLLGLPRADRQLCAERALHDVGLLQRARDRVHGFSKGMQQRLGLAVALVGNPDLLVLDEPTSAMDPVGRHEVSELLRSLRAAGKTIFLNSHLLTDVEGLCDRVALLRKGRVLYTGGLQAITQDGGRYRFTVGNLSDAALALFATEWTVDASESVRGSRQLLVTAPREDLPRVNRWLQNGGADVFEVEAVRQSLDEWFVASLREGGI